MKKRATTTTRRVSHVSSRVLPPARLRDPRRVTRRCDPQPVSLMHGYLAEEPVRVVAVDNAVAVLLQRVHLAKRLRGGGVTKSLSARALCFLRGGER
jgi:hypothetical protein